MEFFEGSLELDDIGQLSVLVGTLDNIPIPKLPDDNYQWIVIVVTGIQPHVRKFIFV